MRGRGSGEQALPTCGHHFPSLLAGVAISVAALSTQSSSLIACHTST